jgi:hypothetical protein
MITRIAHDCSVIRLCVTRLPTKPARTTRPVVRIAFRHVLSPKTTCLARRSRVDPQNYSFLLTRNAVIPRLSNCITASQPASGRDGCAAGR